MSHTKTLRLAGVAALACAALSSAAQAQAPAGVPMLPATMSCEQLTAEIGAANAIVMTASNGINSANGASRGADVASSVAINGALYSGVLGRMPGVGMFANQATAMMKQRAAQKAAEETAKLQDAQMRIVSLQGVYAGKGCGAAAAPAMVPAATAPVPAAPR